MNVAAPTQKQLAEVYRISRQRLHVLRQNYGLATEDFRNPDIVFQTLLAAGRGGKLRQFLAETANRESIKTALRHD